MGHNKQRGFKKRRDAKKERAATQIVEVTNLVEAANQANDCYMVLVSPKCYNTVIKDKAILTLDSACTIPVTNTVDDLIPGTVVELRPL